MGRGGNNPQGNSARTKEQQLKAVQGTVVRRAKGKEESERLSSLLRPGGASDTGFLGADEELENVRSADERTLASLGTSSHELGHRLEEIMEIMNYGRRGPAWRNIDGLEVCVAPMLVRGSQHYPWRGLAQHSKKCQEASSEMSLIIENPAKKLRIKANSLLPHLLAEHNFFQGQQSRHRIDPQLLAQILDFTA